MPIIRIISFALLGIATAIMGFVSTLAATHTPMPIYCGMAGLALEMLGCLMVLYSPFIDR